MNHFSESLSLEKANGYVPLTNLFDPLFNGAVWSHLHYVTPFFIVHFSIILATLHVTIGSRIKKKKINQRLWITWEDNIRILQTFRVNGDDLQEFSVLSLFYGIFLTIKWSLIFIHFGTLREWEYRGLVTTLHRPSGSGSGASTGVGFGGQFNS